jgi:hypothetical protein
MKFTLTFSSDESTNLSYGLVFIPCPVWIQGKREIINLNPERPDYQKGGLHKLLDLEPILSRQDEKHCVLTVHQEGHGSESDLNMLLEDLKQEGYTVTVHNK